jgi:iron complex outermembrane recepter protein
MVAKTRTRAGRSVRLMATARAPMSRSSIALAVAAALAGAGMPGAAARADAADTASGSSGALQEVVVTARKREENLQDVPISIDVFSKKDLENLAINSFDDFAQKVPAISFISTGPGTQLFVCRGVSDGSNPNYANTSSTGFLFDDLSMGYEGGQPDLNLYDIERIEILEGPQGTTFGASAMSCVIRYITNKPDVHAFSAGVDLDGGQIQGGRQNWTYQGFVNIPIIDGILGFRASALSDSSGGFINNELTTRTWVNGTVSNNSVWARNNYNREHIEGVRAALKLVLGDRWTSTLTYGYQRQSTAGAWDEDPTLAPRTVERFGPESNQFQTKTLDLNVQGDVGIGDLTFASTYWQQPRRQWNEYSAYEQNFNAGAKATPPGGYPGTQEGFTCQSDPYYGGTPFTGCNVPVQFYYYSVNPTRESNELRLASKPGGRFHWLGGLYWERTTDKSISNTYYMPGLVYSGAAFQSYANYYGLTQPTLPAGEWYAYTERTDYLQTSEFANISYDLTDKFSLEAGVVHFHSDYSSYTPFAQFAYYDSGPSTVKTDSHKWDKRFGLNYKISDNNMAYALYSEGFRDGGSNAGSPYSCYQAGVPQTYTPDTLKNYELGLKTTSFQNRLVWNSSVYLMDWDNLQSLIYNPLVCSSSSYNINVGKARIYGAETQLTAKLGDNWTVQAGASYNDSRVTSTVTPAYQAYVGERLPFAPYFSWSWNARYEHPLGQTLRGYAQFDMAAKGDMYNGLNPTDKNTDLPRILQPPYIIMNLRFGLNPAGGRWLTEFYISNLADKNAIVYSNTGNFDVRETTNQPRVFGLRVNYRWGNEKNSE